MLLYFSFFYSLNVCNMKLGKAIKMLEILKYIHVNAKCKAPDLRDYLGIIHTNPPTKEEKELYALLNDLSKENYIQKIEIKRIGPGGAKYVFKISDAGSKMLAHLRDYKLLSRGVSFSELDEKAKELSLERMLRVWSSELFDIVLDTVETVMSDILKINFENFAFLNQKEVIEVVNLAVLNIRNRTSEIARAFF